MIKKNFDYRRKPVGVGVEKKRVDASLIISEPILAYIQAEVNTNS